MSALPKYNDDNCEYSLFVSYAHRDDEGNEYWVSELKDAIFQRLNQLPSYIPRKEIHFSQENGPSGGGLGFELESRVQRSFAMLLVVGKQYVDSEWCEKELAMFAKWFPEGTRTRLYIAVMGEDYLRRVEQGDLWKLIVRDDQIWTPMFQQKNRNCPLEHRMNTGERGLPPTFRKAAYRIADRLIDVIQADWAESEANAIIPVNSEATKGNLPTNGKKVLRVAIGPYTKSFDPCESRQPIALLEETLKAAGAEVIRLPREQLISYDPKSNKPLWPELSNADVLIAPLLNETPLLPTITGGHAYILNKEWAALKKPLKDLVWYRPPLDIVPPSELADPFHLDFFKALAPVCTSPQAVVNLYFPIGTSEVIRVYIENHPIVPMYSLSEALALEWAELVAGSTTRLPNLKCVPLRLDQLDDVEKDVAAIVLLDASGYTPKKSLRDRESEVEKCFPKAYAFYPGLVALVFTPPPPKNMPNHLWGDVIFYRSEINSPELKLDDCSRIWLRQFLSHMWQQYQKDSKTATL
jgi:hypothetical protein